MTTEAPSSSPEVAAATAAAASIQGEEEKQQERFAVTPGICHSTTPNTEEDDGECWLSPQNCDGEYEFSIPTQTEKEDSSTIICPTSSINDIQVGSCMYGGLGGGISILCSPNEESCPAGTSFIPPNEGSTNNNCSVGTTKFGSCAGGCRYNPKDCPSGEQNAAWIFPDYDCTCDKVQVGICVFAGQNNNNDDRPFPQHPTMCSVNKEACGDDEDTIFIPTNQVKDMFGFDCYLCGDSNPPPVTLPSETLPTEVVVTSSPAPPSSPSSQDQKDLEWEKMIDEAQQQERNENNNKSSSNGGGGAIIALLIIGITVALVVSAVTIMKRRRQQQQGSKETHDLSQVNTTSTEQEEDGSHEVEENVLQQDYAVTKEEVEEDVPQDYEDFPQEDLLLQSYAVNQEEEVEDYEDFPQVDPVIMYDDFSRQEEEDDSVMTEEEGKHDIFSQEDDSVGIYEDFPHDEEPYDEIDNNSMPSMV